MDIYLDRILTPAKFCVYIKVVKILPDQYISCDRNHSLVLFRKRGYIICFSVRNITRRAGRANHLPMILRDLIIIPNAVLAFMMKKKRKNNPPKIIVYSVKGHQSVIILRYKVNQRDA